MNSIITLKNISKKYGAISILQNVNLAVMPGSFSVFIGPSGCGKSTLLKILTGIEEQTSGSISVPENITMVFQNGSLLPWRTVYENIHLGLEATDLPVPEKEKIIEEYISLMELENFKSSYPRDLSGGQRQRVGIARALVSNPSVLLLDEPFSALDAETTESLHQALLTLWKEKELTIIMVSHSLDEAIELADSIYVMKSGKIVTQEIVPSVRPRNLTSIEMINLRKNLRNLL